MGSWSHFEAYAGCLKKKQTFIPKTENWKIIFQEKWHTLTLLGNRPDVTQMVEGAEEINSTCGGKKV